MAKTKIASELTKRNQGKVRVGIGQSREFMSDLVEMMAEEIQEFGSSPTQKYLSELVAKRLEKNKAKKKK